MVMRAVILIFDADVWCTAFERGRKIGRLGRRFKGWRCPRFEDGVVCWQPWAVE